MKQYFFILIILFLCGQVVLGQQFVTVTPQYPTRGKVVTIKYNPESPLSKNVIPVVHFTYSNLYEMPMDIQMDWQNGYWSTSFTLPKYAVYATFVIDVSGKTIQPENDKHFSVAVYDDNGKIVKNGYLFKGYSLSAQAKNSTELKKDQAALFEEELKHYPDNYEARLRLLSYKITLAGDDEKAMLYKEANNIIADKFYEAPGDMGHTNTTTMGYLIMGEKSRLDSLRGVIKEKYPHTEAGYELRISDLVGMKDSLKMVNGLEKILKRENQGNKRFLTSAHEALFKYYAETGNSEKTLYHLSFLDREFTPYTPLNLKNRATFLYNCKILPDTALSLSLRSLSLVDTFPISLIRYFPETGYLPSFVTREKRAASTKEITGQLKSLMALIELQLDNKVQASRLISEATAISSDNETLKNAGSFYNQIKDFKRAFDLYKEVVYREPEDTSSYGLMEDNYEKWKGSMVGFESFEETIKMHWMEMMTKELEKQIIDAPFPNVINSYVDMSGKLVDSNFIKDKIVIMDFWATWCVPCMKAMPYMEKVYENYKDDSSVIFMIVNSGAQNELSDAQNWGGNKTYSFPVYYNNDPEIGVKLGFNLIPATFVIDSKSRIRFKTLGFEGPSMTRKLTAEIEMLKKMRDK